MDVHEAAQSEAMLDEARRLHQACRFDAALALYDEAIRAFPPNPKAIQHKGSLLGNLGRLAEAEALMRETLAIVPQDATTRMALGGLLMAQGRYAEGSAYYDARFNIERFGLKLPTIGAPRWQSFHPAGKQVLIIPEQGFGDQIQNARFVADLVAREATVTMVVPRTLERLFRASVPAHIVPAEGEIRTPHPDFWIMAADLPAFVGATPETVSGAPYLKAPNPPQGLPDGFKVGLMTKGNPKLEHDARRSLPARWADRLRADLPGAIVELAPEETGARDFADTASIVAALDLVVTVDTAVAHLAGALGTPCFTLLRGFASDWRWPLRQARTPWYGSMRLFWSSVEGDWTGAIEQVLRDARALAG